MPSIQFGGLGSSLDTASIIQAMLDAERIPLLRLQRQEAGIAARRAAYDALGVSIRDLITRAEAFTLTSAGSARAATSSQPATLTASATSAAVPATYQVHVDRLATATTATSTGPLGTAVTGATAGDALATLPLAGGVTAGQVGIVVDGTIVTAVVGDPATTSLQSALDAIAAAIEGRIAATDPGATVSASVVGNAVHLSIAGATIGHAVQFGVASDTSNLAMIAGLTGQGVADFGTGTTTVAGAAALGVVQATATLDAAGLTGLAGTTSGSLAINGVEIGYDTTVDTLGTLLTRINESAVGVVATLDRSTDRIVVASKAAGPTVIDIRDVTGTLGAALRLAPGTVDAQVMGTTSQVTIDGRVVVADSNTISTAISGVRLDLVATGGPATLTVGVDASAIDASVRAFVDAFNALSDRLSSLTSHAEGQPTAPLEGDANLAGLALRLRSMVLDIAPAAAGSLRSLGELGVSTGAIGAAVGTTKRLALDSGRLRAALERDPGAVATLLNGPNGLMRPLVDRLKSLVGSTGPIEAGRLGADAETKSVRGSEARIEARLESRQQSLEAQFARLEATLARLQMVQASLGSQISSLRPRE